MKNIKKVLSLLLISCIILTLLSCAVNKNNGAGIAFEREEAVAEPAVAGFSRLNSKMMVADYDGFALTSANNKDADGIKIIRNVDLQTETKSFDSAISWFKEYVVNNNGTIDNSFVDSGNSDMPNYKKNANFTVRIPVERLDEFLSKIGDNLHVIYHHESATDVTERYDDTVTRIKILTIEQEKLQELLKKAKTVDEMIKVEEKLSSVNEEIYRITNKLQKLDKDIAYSTVNVGIQEVKVLTEGLNAENVTEDKLIQELKKNTEEAKKLLTNFGIYTFTHLPYIGIVVAAIILLLILIAIIKAIVSPKKTKKVKLDVAHSTTKVKSKKGSNKKVAKEVATAETTEIVPYVENKES